MKKYAIAFIAFILEGIFCMITGKEIKDVTLINPYF